MNRSKFTQAAWILILSLFVVSAAFAVNAPKAPKASANTIANGLAICGCGKIFAPTTETEYLKVDGKDYACCSPACHDMAMKDPKTAAAMAQTNMAQILNQLTHMNLGVANVIAVTDKGTQAICGCGKVFTIDGTTEYLQQNGKSYACCSHGCHEMASKDVAAAVQMVEKNIANLH